jgi:hypothetical protein
LLITESADEFNALRDAFEQEIKPRAIIEPSRPPAEVLWPYTKPLSG